MDPSSIYKIRLETPLVVMSAQKLRFGLDKEVLCLSRPTPAEQTLLLALKKGIKLIDLQALALTNGMQKDSLLGFLEKIEPVLQKVDISSYRSKPLLSVIGDFKTERLIASNLSGCAWRVVVGAPNKNVKNQVIISADRYFPNILGHHRWLQEELAVLPIIFSDQSVLVGPVIATSEDYERLPSAFTKPSKDRFRYWASQINETPSATETSSNLLTVSGMIIDQLQASIQTTQTTQKATLALKMSTRPGKIKRIYLSEEKPDSQYLAS